MDASPGCRAGYPGGPSPGTNPCDSDTRDEQPAQGPGWAGAAAAAHRSPRGTAPAHGAGVTHRLTPPWRATPHAAPALLPVKTNPGKLLGAFHEPVRPRAGSEPTSPAPPPGPARGTLPPPRPSPPRPAPRRRDPRLPGSRLRRGRLSEGRVKRVPPLRRFSPLRFPRSTPRPDPGPRRRYLLPRTGTWRPGRRGPSPGPGGQQRAEVVWPGVVRPKLPPPRQLPHMG